MNYKTKQFLWNNKSPLVTQLLKTNEVELKEASQRQAVIWGSSLLVQKGTQLYIRNLSSLPADYCS